METLWIVVAVIGCFVSGDFEALFTFELSIGLSLWQVLTVHFACEQRNVR